MVLPIDQKLQTPRISPTFAPLYTYKPLDPNRTNFELLRLESEYETILQRLEVCEKRLGYKYSM